MITKSLAQQRIQQLIALDNETDTIHSRYNQRLLQYISSHLSRFYEHYADQNGMDLQTASQAVDQWDLDQWREAIRSSDLQNWPSQAKKRVIAYSAIAHVDKGHMLAALIALGMIANTVLTQHHIMNRVQRDGVEQVRRLHRYMHTSQNIVKKGYSIVTDPKTVKIWSKNLWTDTDGLANDVENLVNKHLKHGMSLKDMDSILTHHANPKQFNPKQSLADRVSQMRFNATRIVRTESSRLIDEVNTTTYMQEGVKEVDLVNMIGACQLCVGLADDNPYSIMSAPSIPNDTHPNCRCIKIPHHYWFYVTPNMLY